MSFWDMFRRRRYHEVLRLLIERRVNLCDVRQAQQGVKYSFSSEDEYICTLFFAAKIEEVITEREKSQHFESEIRIIAPKSNNNKFIALLSVPLDCQTEIETDDKAMIYFKATHNGGEGMSSWEEAHWWSRFIEPLAELPPGVMIVSLQKPMPNDLSKRSKYEPQTISWQRDLPLSKQIPSIMKTEGVECKVDTVARHSIFPYIFKAREKLTELDPITKRILLSVRDISKFPTESLRDIYSTLLDPACVATASQGLNKSQMEAIQQARKAPGGFVIAHGGPGTGKTHFIVRAAMPFFLNKRKQHRVLLTSAGNRGADSMAQALHDELQKRRKEGSAGNGAYVIWLHSIKTERAIFRAELEAARRESLRAKPDKKPAQAEKSHSKAASDRHTPADKITTHCHTYAWGKFEGVDDDRVQNIELSLGAWMKRVARVQSIKKPNDYEIPSEWDQFRSLYYRYGNGEDFEEEKEMCFEEWIDELMGRTIAQATAICATVAGAVDNIVTENYGSLAELIVVDEAARVPEYQWWPLLTSYPKAVGKIMVGDPNQLQPALAKGEKNPFAPQLSLSFQDRLQKQGFPATFFSTQYRALPEIAGIYNMACYQGRFMSDASTHVENRPLAQAIRNLNKEKFNVEKNVLFFNIYCKEARDTKTKSRYCDASAHCVMVVLQNLLEAKLKQCKIAILTPYKAQHQRLSYEKTEMAGKYPAALEVALETVDKIQGMEYDVVIIDPVVVKSPGFLDMNRLNVMFSRARHALYVIGASDAWDHMILQDSEPLRKFQAQLRPFEVRWPLLQPSESPFYHSEQYNRVSDGYKDSNVTKSTLSELTNQLSRLEFVSSINHFTTSKYDQNP